MLRGDTFISTKGFSRHQTLEKRFLLFSISIFVNCQLHREFWADNVTPVDAQTRDIMNFNLTEEKEMRRKMVTDFTKNVVKQIAAERDEEERFCNKSVF